jgi:hypothetical protein
VALSNAQRQARWRAKRDRLAAQAISEDDSDREIVRKIVHAIGIERARVLAKFMRNPKAAKERRVKRAAKAKELK